MNYYPFHLGDYHAHTAHLEPMEDLAYRRMLDAYYLREAPLPLDVVEVARLVRMRGHQAEVELVLREFFVQADDGWRHQRCDEEIAHMQDKQAKARASAAASVNARKAKGQPAVSDSQAPAEQTLSERSTTVEQTQDERSTDVQLPTPTPTPTPTPKEKAPRKRDAQPAIACPAGVDESVWQDFLKVRKAKDAPLTLTALEGIKREAVKAGYTLDGAIRVCVERNWQGFRADWVAAPAQPVAMPQRRGAIPDPSDPDTKERIEADGIRLGIGPWVAFDDKTGATTTWPQYAAKVKRARQAERGADE